jgi:hypothetical protein
MGSRPSEAIVRRRKSGGCGAEMHVTVSRLFANASSITHAKGSPWERVARSLEEGEADENTGLFGEYFDSVIPVELMRSYFRSFLPGAK